MQYFLSQIYSEEISSIINHLTDNTNLLITSIDEYVIDIVLDEIKDYYKKMKWKCEDIESKKTIKNNTLVIIKIDGSTSLTTNSILYYYLELASLGKCKVIFVTQHAFAIDNMEKRVKSRFSNHVCVLRSLTHDEYVSLYKYLVYTESPTVANGLKNFGKENKEVKNNSEFKEHIKSLNSDEQSATSSQNTHDTSETPSQEKENTNDCPSVDLVNILLCEKDELQPARKYEKRKSAIYEIPSENKRKPKKNLTKEKIVKDNKITNKDNPNLISEESDFTRRMITDEILFKVSNQYNVNRDTLQLAHLYARLKFGFDEFRLENFLKILDNIHLAILLMCSVENITFNNVGSEFKKFVVNCKELKNSSKDEIFRAFCEITDFNFINEKGNLLINETYLRKYINSSHCPHFLKGLLTKLKL